MTTSKFIHKYRNLRYPYVHAIHLSATSRAKGDIQPLDVNNFITKHYSLISDYLYIIFNRDGECRLIALCYEPEEGIVSHGHFHFLINTANPEFNKSYSRVKKSMNSLKVYLQNRGLLRPEYRLYSDYKGNGKGYGEENGCPVKIAQTCPNKDNCLNIQKHKSCCNVVKNIISETHFLNELGYFLVDKNSEEETQCSTIFIKYSLPDDLPTDTNTTKIKSF